jgi:NTE family protein
MIEALRIVAYALVGALTGAALVAYILTRGTRQITHADGPLSAANTEAPAAQQQPRLRAFVLSGGSAAGSAQAGMLLELVSRGVLPDRVYGASSGAINAVALVSDPTVEGMSRLCSIWRGLSRETIFPGYRALTAVRAVSKRDSLFPNSGLRNIISLGTNLHNIEDSSIPLELVATSLTTGQERRLTSGPIIEAALASAAIPGVFPPIIIDGEALIDGGVVNHVPLAQAINDGATEVYVLHTGDVHPRPSQSPRPLANLLGALSVSMHTRFGLEVEYLARLHPEVTVVVIAAGGDERGGYNDFSAAERLIAAGRRVATEVLDAYTTEAPPALPDTLRKGDVVDSPPRRARHLSPVSMLRSTHA